LAASGRLTGAIRRATIEIDQEFFDRGRTEPSKNTAENTLNGSVLAQATTITLTSATAFSNAGNGNIDGDSFSWTSTDGGITALTIAVAGNDYASGTLSATGGTGSGFTGTYTVTPNGGVTSTTLNAAGTGYMTATTYSTTSSGDGTGLTVQVVVSGGAITGPDAIIAAGSGYIVGEVVTLIGGGSGGNGKLNIQAIDSTTGAITAVSITAAGIYAPAPTAIVISDSGDTNASITSTFTMNRLTGCTGISFDHATAVTVQEGEMAHILREVCADIAAGFIYEDQAVFGDGKDLRSNTFRQRGIESLKRLAHHGGIA
jgi:hypothetical protein